MITSFQTLIFTRKSETVAKSFKRYIGTLVHVTAWYFGDVWQTDHPARRSIQMVRSMHDHVARTTNHPEKRPLVDKANISECGPLFTEDRPMLDSIHKDARANIGSCPFAAADRRRDEKSQYLYFNQFDMADTQFAFVGVLLLFPRQFGAMFINDDDLRGFIHFWRCIGCPSHRRIDRKCRQTNTTVIFYLQDICWASTTSSTCVMKMT